MVHQMAFEHSAVLMPLAHQQQNFMNFLLLDCSAVSQVSLRALATDPPVIVKTKQLMSQAPPGKDVSPTHAHHAAGSVPTFSVVAFYTISE
jgi:hypothetical protein